MKTTAGCPTVQLIRENLQGLVFLFLAIFIFSDCSRNPSSSGPDNESDPVTDIDGNVYRTVKIGDHVWMTENLRVIHYRNGDSIPQVENYSSWTTLLSGACCYYNNEEKYAEPYGCIYNWYAVDDFRNMAPEGWHVPSDQEWMELEMALGMEQDTTGRTGYRGTDEGGRLKAKGTKYWFSPNTGATDEYGFSAVAGGYRYSLNGAYLNMGYYSHFWTSTESDLTHAWIRGLDFDRSAIRRRGGWNMRNGFSVRCVKDSGE